MIFGRKDNVQTRIEQPSYEFRIYQGNGFSISQPDGWEDKTIHTIMGPVDNGIQHNILITVEPNVPFKSVDEYADIQITAIETELQSCILLKREKITLANGFPAYKVVFRWTPSDKFRVYQEQIFVLADKTAYKLTTTFTKKTRKTLGPAVERILMSFQPGRI
jgi:hypothetical protein